MFWFSTYVRFKERKMKICLNTGNVRLAKYAVYIA